ncbi:MAG: response regulator [Hydrogenovibrio sp.]|uniref:hybrid sensor histidine kinase/response regulator n=1 Tax=Hydrogenovibrio sp. TaxID=2065821 RepID=UPI0028708BC6|nr:response regulator [Hydrogenovibrio sp.]MDR9498686.1 response regulator [Hydrogenovibrio sp.]
MLGLSLSSLAWSNQPVQTVSSQANSEPVVLEGPWALYWKKWVQPESFDQQPPQPDALTSLPGSWSKIAREGQSFPALGFSTYFLRLTLPEKRRQTFVIHIPMVYSAYELYINGQLRASVGKISQKSVNRSEDYGKRQVYIDPTQPATLNLVFHISNTSSRIGGFPKPITIGSAQAINEQTNQQLIANSALAGGLLLIAFSQLAIFLLRRHEYAYFFFALTTLFWAIRLLFSAQILSQMGIHPPLKLARVIDGYTALMSGVMYVLFLSSLFNRYLPVRYARWVLVLPLIYVPFVFFAHEVVRSQAIGYLLLLMLLAMVIAMVAVFYAWIKRHQEAGVMVFGGLVMLLTALMQLYLFEQAGVKETSASIGVLLAVALHSYALARRYSRAFQRSQALELDLRHANQLKDDFLANTSHELKTPLHGMIGLAEALARQKQDSATRQALHLIGESGHRLARLVNEIMDFTRLQHNDLQVTRKPLDPAGLVKNVMATSQPLADQKRLQLTLAMPSALPHIYADPDRLEQVLFNLIGNAIKFTDEGEVRLALTPASDNLSVIFEISDSGLGIPESEIERLQQPYEQAFKASEKSRGGLGLGLSISKKVLQLHDSNLEIDSQPHRGTLIRFQLPISEPTLSTASPSLAKESEPLQPVDTVEPPTSPVITENTASVAQSPASQPHRGANILVVDDDPTARKVLRTQLVLSGYQVTTAGDGNSAIKAVTKQTPDLILLDIMMPDISGLAVCRQLREEFDANNLPIILVTAKNRSDDIIEGLKAGANDYLAKPFYQMEMIARVESQLRVHDNEQMRWALNECQQPDKTTHKNNPRENLVSLLKESVRLWENETGKHRADLAEESGLWTVTLDGSVRKTRTLDRYLKLKTLPKRPRWSIVLQTARFVIASVDHETGAVQNIQNRIQTLEADLRAV